METNNVKKVFIDLEPKDREQEKQNKKSVKTEKEKQKRQVTSSIKWLFGEPELSTDNQWKLLQQIYKNEINDKDQCKIMLDQMQGKLYGYKSQDLEKSLYNENEFIVIKDVIKKLIQCENKCYYCSKKVQILYEYVRESNQWTLERLDNDFGHNTNNVVIACLSCNLRRKTMHPERFLFTKQLNIIKKI
jgi:hypothetical protein